MLKLCRFSYSLIPILAADQTITFHFAIECRTADPQSYRSLMLVPIRFLQNLQNKNLFIILKRSQFFFFRGYTWRRYWGRSRGNILSRLATMTACSTTFSNSRHFLARHGKRGSPSPPAKNSLAPFPSHGWTSRGSELPGTEYHPFVHAGWKENRITLSR